MASHARHARRSAPGRPAALSRGLVRAGLTVSAGAAFVAGGAGAASAAAMPVQPPRAVLGNTDVGAGLRGADIGLQKGAEGVFNTMRQLQANPFAETSADPLDNSVNTQVADFKPVSTAPLMEPLTTRGGLIQNLASVGPLAQLSKDVVQPPAPAPGPGAAPAHGAGAAKKTPPPPLVPVAAPAKSAPAKSAPAKGAAEAGPLGLPLGGLPGPLSSLAAPPQAGR
ncbi:hypothetical protein [Streptomyces eurocidicus]|uniref:Uncharacterized protein n=1 Tax=Streptomyces eurocidicus TaxID=66423 RepID=A0A7W8F2L7_STREU|nr:hypothetical protein [Streptomyces eurocidicus]MBB5119687.1 hypothetical protein [Streptomyces eurocidicus]